MKSEMERALIEEEVLNDLADHPTVEYIRRLEDERTYLPVSPLGN